MPSFWATAVELMKFEFAKAPLADCNIDCSERSSYNFAWPTIMPLSATCAYDAAEAQNAVNTNATVVKTTRA